MVSVRHEGTVNGRSRNEAAGSIAEDGWRKGDGREKAQKAQKEKFFCALCAVKVHGGWGIADFTAKSGVFLICVHLRHQRANAFSLICGRSAPAFGSDKMAHFGEYSTKSLFIKMPLRRRFLGCFAPFCGKTS
jgi:hypothetical protein